MKFAIVVGIALVIECVSAPLAHAQPRPLDRRMFAGGPIEDEPPYIDLLTFGVGERIFEKFGHAAVCLRYHDPNLMPICFNYGVTDFAEGPGMLWSFLRSEQKFWVEPTMYGEMYGFYRWEDRDIWLQTLPVTGAQARALERKLWDSLDESHRYYYYDHFFDNCTTRLRDMIDEATNGALAVGAEARYPLTFRELGYRGIAELPPLIVISDFVMGRQLDDYPTVWQAMFHPDIFREQVERKLGVAPKLLYKREGYKLPGEGANGRLAMGAISLLVALPLLLARSRGRAARIAIHVAYWGVLAYVLRAIMPGLWEAAGVYALIVPVVAVAVFALAHLPARGEQVALGWATFHLAFWGLLVWSLVAISSIVGVRWNEVVFVVLPFDLVLPFLRETRRRRYAQVRVTMLLLASLLCAIGVLHQPLWLPILAVFLPMAILAFDLPDGFSVSKRKVT